MGRKPLAGLRPRRPSRPSGDPAEPAAAALRSEAAKKPEDKSANSTKKNNKELDAQAGNVDRSSLVKQRSRWRKKMGKIGGLDGHPKTDEIVPTEDSGLEESGPFSSGGESFSAQRSSSFSEGGGIEEDGHSEGGGGEGEDELFRKVSLEDQGVIKDPGGHEDQPEDVSGESEQERVSDHPLPEIDPEVLKHFGEPLNDLYVEDLALESVRIEPAGQTKALYSTSLRGGLTKAKANLPTVNLDKTVEEIITKIKSRSLLADRTGEMEEKESARGATVDFASFNWKPDVVFFQFGEGGRQGDGPAGLPPGQVFTFTKATPPTSPTKKRLVQKPARVKNGPKFRFVNPTKIHRTK